MSAFIAVGADSEAVDVSENVSHEHFKTHDGDLMASGDMPTLRRENSPSLSNDDAMSSSETGLGNLVLSIQAQLKESQTSNARTRYLNFKFA